MKKSFEKIKMKDDYCASRLQASVIPTLLLLTSNAPHTYSALSRSTNPTSFVPEPCCSSSSRDAEEILEWDLGSPKSTSNKCWRKKRTSQSHGDLTSLNVVMLKTRRKVVVLAEDPAIYGSSARFYISLPSSSQALLRAKGSKDWSHVSSKSITTS